MIGFSKVLANPWVWGAGVILGVLVLSASSRGAATSSAGASDPYAFQGTGASLAGYNAAALAAISASAGQAAATSRSNSANNLARDLKVMDTLNSSGSVWAALQGGLADTAAGITKSRIASETALAIDRGQNEVRMQQTYVAGNVSTFAAQLAAQTAKAQTDAALKATLQANQINGQTAAATTAAQAKAAADATAAKSAADAAASNNNFWSGVFGMLGSLGAALIPALL
jgi:hypothetical protein